MRFRMSWKIALIVLALLAILVVWFAYHRLAPFVSDLDTVLAGQLTAELNRAVSIESARVISRNQVVITGLRIAQGRSFEQGTLFTVKRVTAEVDVVRIATGRGSVGENVRSVTLVDPSLALIRDRNGVLNIKDLLERPPVPPAERFRGTIQIESGRMTLTDHASLLARGPAINTVASIRGTIDCRPGDMAQVDLAGLGEQGRVGRLTLRGQLGTGNPLLTKLNLTVAGANAGYWLDYFSTISSWSLHDGVLSASALVYRTAGGNYTAKGTGTIHDGSITSPHLAIPLRQVAADVSFVGTAIRLRADARLRGSPIHAAGTILAGRTLNLRVTSNRMGPLTLQQAVRGLPTIPNSTWPTLLSFDAVVFGSTGKPRVRATVSIPRAIVFGLTASGITASGAYSDGDITINGKLRTAGGAIRMSGTVAALGRLNLAVTASGVDAGALLGPFGYRQATGTADFDGRLKGTISSPVLTGALTARNGHLQQIAFDFLHARLTAGRDYLILTDATIRRQGSEIATTGFVRIAKGAPAEIDLRATGQRLSLAEIAQLAGLTIKIEGGAEVDLRIKGRYPNLLPEGTIAITDAKIAGFPVDSARIDLRTVDGHTSIEQFVASRGDMRLIGSGSIGSRGELNIAVTGEALDLSLLNQALSPYATMSGQMDFTGTVSGTASDPRISGELVSTSPVVNQTQFDRLVGSLTWDGTTISLLDASLTRADVLYSVRTFQFDTHTESIVLDTGIGSARLENLLALFRNSPYLQTPAGETLKNALETVPPNASGKVDAMLNLSGPIGDLSGTGTVNGSDIVLGPTQISSVQLGFTAQRSIFHFSNLDFVSPGINMKASAQFAAGEPTGLTAKVTDTQVGALVALVENMPFLAVSEFGQGLIAAAQSVPTPASGFINATVELTDIRQGGTGSVSAQIADLSLADQAVGMVTASAHLVQGAITIDQLDISGPLATAGIQGSINSDQVISLNGRIEHISLALLGPLIGVPKLSGTADIILQATGPLDDPRIQASLSGANVETPQAGFDSITVPNLVIAAGRLTASQITAVKGASQILASASLPFSWETPFIPQDQPIDVQVSAPTQDLAGLAKFLSIVQSASGALSMNLGISGTIKDPVTSGSLVVQNGKLNVERFDSDFKDIEIDATFQGSTLQINRFTGASSFGGTFTVTGKVELPSLSRAVIDGTLAMDGLRMSVNNLTGVYRERVTMTATGLLNLTESLQAPLIQGDLVVSDAVIRVPEGELPKPGTTGYSGPNPRFDVTLNLASNVRIQRGPLQVEAMGPVSIAGSLSQPDIIGTVALTAGSLRYPGRTFTLLRGGSATFVWQSPDPPSIAIDLRATTRVIAQSPFTGRLTRYTIYLDVGGTIDSLIIGTTSSPPGLTDSQALALIFRQAEIEALLSGVDFQQMVEQQLADTLLGLALPGIFEGIELGALTIGLDPGIAVPLQAWVSLQVTDQFAISYLQTLISGTPFNVFEASYALSPQFALSVQFQQNEEVLYLIQSGWRF